MDFKQEFLTALQSHKDCHALLEIVRRHRDKGLTAEESYTLLEQIWREYGFDESEDAGPLRDDLEYVMEKVWYQSSSAG